jgi:hypothetical protein
VIHELEDSASASGNSDSEGDFHDIDYGNNLAISLNLDNGLDSDVSSDSNDSHNYTGERCSFCDERLNFVPSQTLRDMRAPLQNLSEPDPIPGYPDHRRAKSFTVTISYCQRHRMEAKVFPIACCQGWPSDVDFSKLHERVVLHRTHLEPLLQHDNVKNNEFYKDVMATFAPGTSIAAASGAAGQWASFKGHGAG